MGIIQLNLVCESCGVDFHPNYAGQSKCMLCDSAYSIPTKDTWMEGVDKLVLPYFSGALGQMGSKHRGFEREGPLYRFNHPHNRKYKYKPRPCKICGKIITSPGPRRMRCNACQKIRDKEYLPKRQASFQMAYAKKMKAIYGPTWVKGQTYCVRCGRKFMRTKTEHKTGYRTTWSRRLLCPGCTDSDKRVNNHTCYVCHTPIYRKLGTRGKLLCWRCQEARHQEKLLIQAKIASL